MNRYTSFFSLNKIYESIKWNYVIRDGKKVRKPQTDKEGYKITYDDAGHPHETKIGGAERTQMSRQNKKSARKAKSKKNTTVRKIQKSIVTGKQIGRAHV